MAYPMLIGSKALEYWYPNVTIPTDVDIITELDIKGVDTQSLSILNNKAMVEKYGSGEFIELKGNKIEVMSLEGLAILKRSHLFREKNFNRNIGLYYTFLRKYMNFSSKEYKDRTKATQKMFKSPSLRMSNEEFFDNPLTKLYDHDWLHTKAAYYNKPLYLQLKTDFSSAWCEKDLWDLLSTEDKFKCAAEEVYVIASERFLIPQKWPKNKELRSYMKALEKVCTTLTSGWFRDFALDNYVEMIAMFNKDKFKEIKKWTN